MRLLYPDGIEKIGQHPNERIEVAAPDVLGGGAVAGQVQGIDGVLRGQGFLVEDPDVDVAPEAVEQNERLSLALADHEVLDALAAGLDDLGFRSGLSLFLGDERLLKLLDVGVYLLVGDVGRGDHAQKSADRDLIALLGYPPAQDARRRGFDGVVDLLALDLDDLVAFIELRSLFDEPLDNRPLGHREAPLGHPELGDLARLAHALAPAPVVSRTAAATLSGSGT